MNYEQGQAVTCTLIFMLLREAEYAAQNTLPNGWNCENWPTCPEEGAHHAQKLQGPWETLDPLSLTGPHSSYLHKLNNIILLCQVASWDFKYD